MSSGSESEGEFYDAQDAPPDATHTAHSAHHHKRGSLSKHTSGEKSQPAESRIGADPDAVISLLAQSIDDDHASVKNVVQGRQKFRELRKHMQTEDEDATPTTNSTPDSQTSSVEGLYAIVPKAKHPFKIIEHDAMSLQSMTSLGRIGRILSGAGESSGNVLTPAGVSREPSTLSDEQMPPPPPPPPPQPGLAMQEPDVIASTKSNSLKHSRPADGGAPAAAPPSAGASHRAHAHTEPVPPPRRKKRGKMYSSQSLCGSDGDNVSVSTTDDSYRFDARATHTALAAHGLEKGPLQRLIVEPALTEMLFPHQALPSPASTIESLTRDFQHSLDHAKLPAAAPGANTPNTGGRAKSCATSPADRKASAERLNRSGSSSRSSTTVSVRSHHSTNALSSNQYSLDIKSAIKGHYVVKPQDEDTLRSSGPLLPGSGRTQSEDRAPGAVGHSSLGSAHRWREEGGAAGGGGRGRERRRSAGDEEALARRVERELRQLNMKLRTRTDSGKQLSDMEILEQVTVLNLDTGERVPLSVAEHKLPQCVNPLSLHIMRLTSEYISSRSNDDDNTRETDEESECVGLGADGNTDSAGSGSKRGSTPTGEQPPTGIRRKTDNGGWPSGQGGGAAAGRRGGGGGLSSDRLKRFLGSTVKKTMDAAKSLAQEVSHARHKEDVGEIADDVRGETNIKLKASNSHKGPYDFDGCVRHVQEMSGQHAGAVWCMKFSVCGRLLATAGQDKLLRVWVLRDAAHFFQDMRTEYNAAQKSSPTPSQESLASLTAPPHSPEEKPPPGPMAPFCPKPFCTYIGHTSDLLDVAWSKNYFVLSSSMDKTVRLWHISRGECLCCFQHIDFVTAIAFHPRDDRYFLSGSLDGKLRLWNIPDKKVAVWNEVDGQTKLITAANFCQNGKFAVVGTYDGRCIFYTTDQLKYHTQIDVRSTRGKNSTGRKISGIEPMPNDDKILVTSNDSRIRLYDLRDLNLSCKYKGYVNVSSQIKASFSHDGKYIVSGSENQCIYIWKTHHDYSKFSSVRRDRNDFWEGIKAHSAVVTCAVFAPNPEHVIRGIAEREDESASRGRSAGAGAGAGAAGAAAGRSHCAGHVLLSADFNGCIKVFVNKSKPKHSSLPASALA